ncbi:Gfo/Idh/MocA family protein [Occultella kanbiaonis]|uniref:Gfo/Idh/MocA family protein n=1 Tax=Occultella kanbiaonis TaxID=2675754 RepID=UPI0013D48EFD|nr:Gfo/Idh/MocA family oxidoreductase [Occultella kanbiaonis]
MVGAARGAGFLSALTAARERVKLLGIYDPDPVAAQLFLAEHGGERTFPTFAEAVTAADAVILASPQHYHAPQAVHALDAGVHVLSEVPAVVSLEQASDLLAATRRGHAQYMLAENYGYMRSNLIVGAMVRAGLLGQLYSGEAEYLHEMKEAHRTSDGAPTWRYHWQVGRNGITYPTHSLGPLLEWMDDRIEAVSCVGTGRWTDSEHEMHDSVTLLGRTRRGGLVRTRLDLLSNRPHLWDYYAVQGTGGAYEAPRARGDGAKIYLEGRSPRHEWEPLERYAQEFLAPKYAHPPEGSGHGGSDIWPLLDFLEAIETDTQPPIGVYRALDMTLPGIVSEESIAQGGGWVRVPNPRTLTAGIGTEPGHEGSLS